MAALIIVIAWMLLLPRIWTKFEDFQPGARLSRPLCVEQGLLALPAPARAAIGWQSHSGPG